MIWDLPTRVFHWLLVAGLAGSWITAEAGFEWTEWHFALGYFNLGLVLFRLCWGVLGTRHARFTSFLRGPGAVVKSARSLFSRTPGTSVGHNPLGGWSAVLLLALVAVQAGTGLFISDDIFYAGPYNSVVSSDLAGTLAQIHHLNFLVLQITVVLHVSAVLWYWAGKKQNLITPMLTGRKPGPPDNPDAITSSRLGRALLVILVCLAAVTLLVQLAPPPPVEDYF